MEHSPLVQRAVQRLRDNIARREITEDVEALKAVLIEMSAQKERADTFERRVVKAELECEELARRIGDQSGRLAVVTIERDGLRKMFEDEKATSTDLEKLNELMTLDFERERNENERLRKELNQIAMSAMSSEYAKGRAAIALNEKCGCAETYPQLLPGKVSHAPGCKE